MKTPLKFIYHRFNVPLNWEEPTSGEIQICVRELLDLKNTDKPPILFFQGGPGFESPFPHDQAWIRQLQKRFRVFLLDQRGTGLSSPIDLETIRKLDSVSHEHAIEYLCNFRSDSIAKDAEHIRLKLFSDQEFNIFGQSFGGWCIYSYLSQFPNSASSAIITGGFPPMFQDAHEVYTDLLPQISVATEKFYKRFPETFKQLTSLFEALDGKVLSLLSLSGVLIGHESQEYSLCSIIEDLYFDIENIGRPTKKTINRLKDPMGLINNPLYLFLHESIYCNDSASNWAGERVFVEEHRRPTSKDPSNFFLSETIARKYFELEELSPFLPLMDSIMAFDGWSKQFNEEQLKQSSTRVTGVIYSNDAYVSKKFSEKSAALIRDCEVVYSDLDHHAMRDYPEIIFPLLLDSRI